MNDIAIQVQALGKQYAIGRNQEKNGTLRDSIVAAFNHSWDTMRGGKSRRRKKAEDSFWALRGVSFEVKRGEVIGVIGRNGAGKSTLLKMLSRITEPTEGRIIVRGRVGSLLEVGTGFHPELTGRENVYMNAAILGMRRCDIERKFEQIVSFAEIGMFLDTPVKRYSSGMLLRLGFSVAAHLEPDILVVDEVLAVGDAHFQKKCLGKIGEVSNAGRTVLFVSHNMGAVQALTSKALLLRDGSVRSFGRTAEIIQDYLSSVEANVSTDVSERKRLSPLHGKEVRIKTIHPLAKNGGAFVFGEDLRFAVEIHSKKALKELRFGCTILDLAGTPVFTSFTPSEIDTLEDMLSSYEICLGDSRLAPGTYQIDMSIGEGSRSGGRKEYDIVKQGPQFTVESVGLDGTAVFNWRREAYGSIVHSVASITTRPPIENRPGR